MPSGKFDLIGEIRLAGPVNLTQVANNIQSKLSGITANVKVRVDGTANRSLSALNTKFVSLNKNIIAANQSAKNLSATISAMSYAFSKLQAQSIKNTSTQVKQISKNLKQTKKSADEAADAIEDFGAKTSLALKRFAAYTLATTVIFGLVRAFQSSVSEAIQFERSLIKVEQATRTSTRNIEKLNAEITRLAKGFGVSSSELVEVSRTLSQAGLKINEVETALEALAKSSLAPTFGDIADTTEGAIAAISQFKLGAEDLEGVLGSINAVAANFAVESEDIISAIRRAGGVFAAASAGAKQYDSAIGGIGDVELPQTEKLRQFVALFTSVRSTTRESAETIATGLRTILTRIQRPATLSALQGIGVDLTDQQGKFIGAFESFRKLNESLSKLDTRDPKFNKIVEELGGFRQVGKVIPLILNFNDALRALEVGRRGTNSLEEDSVKALESLAVQIDRTRENFKAFVREFVASDTFKAFANQVLGIANAFIEVGKSLKPLFPILGIFAAIKAASTAIKFTRGFLGNISSPQQDVAGALSNATKGQSISSTKLLLSTNITNNLLVNILRELSIMRSATVGKSLKNNFSRVPFTGFDPPDITSGAGKNVGRVLPKVPSQIPFLPFGAGVRTPINPSLLLRSQGSGQKFGLDLKRTRYLYPENDPNFIKSISLNSNQVYGPPRPPRQNKFVNQLSTPTFARAGNNLRDFANKNRGGTAVAGILASSLIAGAVGEPTTATGAAGKGAFAGAAAGGGIGFALGGIAGPLGAAAGAVIGFATSLDAFNKKKTLDEFERSIEKVTKFLSNKNVGPRSREAALSIANDEFVNNQTEVNQPKKLLGNTGSKLTTFGITGITDFILKQVKLPSLGEIFREEGGFKKLLGFDRSPELAKIGQERAKAVAAQLELFAKRENEFLVEEVTKSVRDQNKTSGQALRDLLGGEGDQLTNVNRISSALIDANPALKTKAETATEQAITFGTIDPNDSQQVFDFFQAKVLQFADLDNVLRKVDLETNYKEIEFQINKLNRTFDVLSGVVSKFNADLDLTIQRFDNAENAIRGVVGNISLSDRATNARNIINNPAGVSSRTFAAGAQETFALSNGNQVIGNALNLINNAEDIRRNLFNIFERANTFRGENDQGTIEAAAAGIIRADFGGVVGESIAQKLENVLAPREAALDEIQKIFQSGELLQDIPELDQARKTVNDFLLAFENATQKINEETKKYVAAQARLREADARVLQSRTENRNVINQIRTGRSQSPLSQARDIAAATSLRAGFDVTRFNLGDAFTGARGRLSDVEARAQTGADPIAVIAEDFKNASTDVERFRAAIEFTVPALDDLRSNTVRAIEDLRRQSGEARSFFVNFASSDASGRRRTITDLNNAGIAARGGVLPLGPEGVGSAFRGIDAIASFNPEIADKLRRETLVNQFQAAGVDLNQKTLVQGPEGEFLTLKEVLLGGSKPEEQMVALLQQIANYQEQLLTSLADAERAGAGLARDRFSAVASAPLELNARTGGINPKTGELTNIDFSKGVSQLQEVLAQLNETQINIAGEINANVNITGGDALADAVAEKIQKRLEEIVNRSAKETTDQIMGKNTGPRNTGFYRNSQGNYQGARAF